MLGASYDFSHICEETDMGRTLEGEGRMRQVECSVMHVHVADHLTDHRSNTKT